MRGLMIRFPRQGGAKGVLIRNNSTATSVDPQHDEVQAAEWGTAKPYSYIPGPKPLPVVGNAHLFVFGKYDVQNLINFQTQVKNEFGNISRFTGLPKRNDMVLVFEPEDIEKIYRQEGIWPERPSLKSMRYYREITRKDFFQGHGGVLNDQGEAWQKARSQVNPVMMQTRIVQMYAKRINDVADDFVVKIPDWRDKDNQMPADFNNELHKWALESIAVIALDTRLGCLAPNLAPNSEPQQMINAVHTMFQCMHKLEIGSGLWNFVSTPAWRKFVSTMDFFVEVSMKYINQAMERIKQRTGGMEDAGVLERFLARDPNPIRAVIMALDMLLAGVDTTSHSISNTLLHLSKSPEKQDKLFEEMKKFLPEMTTPITIEMLNEMKYLKACIRESLRMAPVATGNVRTTKSEIVLSGFQIPKGVDILMASGSMSRMDKHFPEAAKYIPERWLREKDENPYAKANPFVSLPFGHGARKCVGMRFASLEMETLLAKLIRRFQWEWHHPEMRYKSTLIHAPADPLRFTVHPRK